MQKRIVVLAVILFLSLGCSLFFPESQNQVEPTQVPIQVPTTIPTGAATLPPLPDFQKDIVLSGWGGGGPPICYAFYNTNLPSVTSVIGRITYPTVIADLDDTQAPDYPRGAQLCLTGVPKDESINIKFISPDQKVTLKATVQIVSDSDPSFKNDLDVIWIGYPDFWSESNGPHLISSFADRQTGNPNDLNKPIIAELDLWWPGSLESGVWMVEASWPGETIDGVFDANTRSRPEISLGDPDFQKKLFPVTGFRPYMCHLALSDQPFFAVLEAFPPSTPVYVLVYSVGAAGGRTWTLAYRAVTYSDDQGGGVVKLATNFGPDTAYYLSLQRRFALLRRFDYYYDVSRMTMIFSSYTCWRLSREGDRHEKDYSTSTCTSTFPGLAARAG